MSDRVSVDSDGQVLLIGINRPAKTQRNAFDLATIAELSAAYERFAADPQMRVGVLYGHGEHFSAGLDLAEVGPAVAKSGPQALKGPGLHDPFGLWGVSLFRNPWCSLSRVFPLPCR
nr:enoyl-CoA hydratase-related protein [Fodinicola feengrottensis]